MNLTVLETWVRARLAHDEQGANLVEYILLIALIALGVIGAIVFLRTRIVDNLYLPSGSRLSDAN